MPKPRGDGCGSTSIHTTDIPQN